MILDSFSFDSITPVSPTTTNLVAWYALEDVTDSHTGGYDLTNNGTVTFTSGKNSNAATFDGSTQSLSRADEAGLSLTGAQTWACWIKVDSFPSSGNEGIMTKWQGTGDQRTLLMAILPGGGITCVASSTGGGGNPTVNSSNSVVIGIWTHVALVYSPSTSLSVYINGFNKGDSADTIPASLYDGTSELELGGYNSGSFLYDGQIDDACIFNKALSLAEIKWLAAGNTYSDL